MCAWDILRSWAWDIFDWFWKFPEHSAIQYHRSFLLASNGLTGVRWLRSFSQFFGNPIHICH